MHTRLFSAVPYSVQNNVTAYVHKHNAGDNDDDKDD